MVERKRGLELGAGDGEVDAGDAGAEVEALGLGWSSVCGRLVSFRDGWFPFADGSGGARMRVMRRRRSAARVRYGSGSGWPSTRGPWRAKTPGSAGWRAEFRRRSLARRVRSARSGRTRPQEYCIHPNHSIILSELARYFRFRYYTRRHHNLSYLRRIMPISKADTRKMRELAKEGKSIRRLWTKTFPNFRTGTFILKFAATVVEALSE